jgi:hypothetical protein
VASSTVKQPVTEGIQYVVSDGSFVVTLNPVEVYFRIDDTAHVLQ